MLIKHIRPILLTGMLALLSLRLLAQNPGFVQTDVIKVSGVTSNTQVNTLPLGQIQTTRVFIDGLGRPVQSVALQASPVANKDIVQPEVYNTLGQQTTGYLPYTDNAVTHPSGSFRTTATADQLNYYKNSGTTSNPNKVANEITYPYNQRVFENSPLQRVLKAGMTGTGFQPTISGNKYKTVSYRLNNAAQDGNIMIWSTSGTFASTYYADNKLSVTDGTDEDGLEARTFTDAAGRLILKRQLNSGAYVDTYYVYNVGGMVSYIIPPLALSTMVSSGNYSLSASPVNTLVFVFTYDNLGRLIEKTAPAKGKVSIVYDPLNRPVLMQDANMLASNQWNYIRYDVKGRAISQGIYVDATRLGRSAMQTYVSGLAYTTWYESRNTTQSTGYYSASVFPTTTTGTLTPLAYAYFDDYKLNPSGTAYSYISQGLTNEETATTAPVKGMPTMVRKATVGTGLSNIWLLSVSFYDKRLNPIQTLSNNQLYYTLDVLTDNKTTVPDFSGVPQTGFVKKQTAATTTVTVKTTLTYDYMYRIKTIGQSYNGAAAVTVANYTYNEMGQLVKKGLGLVSGTTYLQNVDMRYNIRGLLTTINNSTLTNDSGTTNTNGETNDAFGMEILYDKVDGNLSNTAYYNGRISGVKWMSLNGSGAQSYERAFRYYYDGMARDTAAIYSQRPAGSSSTTAFTVTNGWNENRITYDVNGNIKTMFRDSSVQGTNSHYPIDNLTYTYDSTNPNRLLNVTDGTTTAYTNSGFRNRTGSTASYTYDANGNLTNEPYKGIATIAYNYLNRTDKITFSSSANKYMEYTYDASGSLIRKRQYDNIGGVLTLQNTTDYIDGFVYLAVGTGSSSLQFFSMPEGRVVYNGSTFTPTYTISDHQGNVRVEFDNTGTGGIAKVRQENSYYTFGLIMPGSTVATPGNDNKNLYNGGAEWQKDYGNLPDYYQTFYRNYDAALGRWVGVDPMAESAESMTTYQYAGNNPVMFNDPLGNIRSAPQDDPLTYYGHQSGPGDDIERMWANDFNATLGVLGIGYSNAQLGIESDANDPGGYLARIRASGDKELLDAVTGGNAAALYHYNEMHGTAYVALAWDPQGGGSITRDEYEALLGHASTAPEGAQFSPGAWRWADGANQGGYPVGFKQFVATILGEARDGNPVQRESAALGGTIINRLNNAKESLHDPNWMNKVGTASAFDGVHTARYKWAMESTTTLDQIAAKYPVQFAGALQAFNNWGTDYSGNPNPAYYWTAAGLTGNFYSYQQYLLGNMVRNTIGGTTFYSFTNPNWSWK